MKYTELKLPKTTADLRIHHFSTLARFSETKIENINQAVELIADFLGVHVNMVKQIDRHDVMNVYGHICNLYAGIRIEEPKKQIELDGQKFDLINPDKVGVGWHIDFESCDIEKDPVRLACLYYFPSGQIYGATDENYNIINPIASRKETIENHLPLQDFINCNAFFLRKSKTLIQTYMVQEKTKKIATKLLNLFRGKKPLTT